MKRLPYAKIIKEELILRDHLAADRTILANERTFLAYSRTALTTFVVGVSLLKLFNTFVTQLVGFVFIMISLVTFVFGFKRYRDMEVLISGIKNHETKNKKEIEGFVRTALLRSPSTPEEYLNTKYKK